MSTEITLIEKSKSIDNIILSVIGNKGLNGFQKAHMVSTAIVELEALLDENYMSPIMKLQGTTLGFKTDKDLMRNPNGSGYVKGPGYTVDIVKRCLIEAVLKGYQPTNNEFNIIGGNMYPAKNGLERKANEWEGLKYSIIQVIRTFSVEKGSALVDCQIKWSYNDEKFEENVPIPLKIDQYTSVDAMLGKAKRKALAWLLSNISGEIIVDGDVTDVELTQRSYEVSYIAESPLSEEEERVLGLLEKVETLEEFKKLKKDVPKEVLEKLKTHFENAENTLIANS